MKKYKVKDRKKRKWRNRIRKQEIKMKTDKMGEKYQNGKR